MRRLSYLASMKRDEVQAAFTGSYGRFSLKLRDDHESF